MLWRDKLVLGWALCGASGCYLHHGSAPDAGSPMHSADTGVTRDAAIDATFVDAMLDATSYDAATDAFVIDAPIDAPLDHDAPDANVDAYVPIPIPGVTYFKPNRSESLPQAGESVALSADTLVVGAPYDNDPNVTWDNGLRGAAYIFVRAENGWVLQQRIARGLGGTGAAFGRNVAISGDTIAVGAEGTAYVFKRRNGMWLQQAQLFWGAYDGANSFGLDIAISGDTVVVGAPVESSSARGINGDDTDNSAYASGAAYVFALVGDAWVRQAYLKASNADASDGFGHSVGISGNTVVVSAPGEASGARGVNGDQNDNDHTHAGAVYVFVRNDGTWTQQAYLKASNTEQDLQSADQFGTSVAIHHETIAVGAWAEASNATGVDGDQFNNDAPGNGAVYVFARDGTTWSQQAYVKGTALTTNALFGDRVDLHDDTLVVGARNDSDPDEYGNPTWDSSGAVYLFSRRGTQWYAGARVRAPNPGWADWFGWDVAVHGMSIAVGAPSEASSATGINGDQSDDSMRWVGAAYVFDAIDELGLLSP